MMEQPVRDAATLILYRYAGEVPQLLMGRRPASSAFMPNKYVFPGGATEDGDRHIAFAKPPDALTMNRLAAEAPAGTGRMVAAAAIRELFEECGLALGTEHAASAAAVPKGWEAFCGKGLLPDASALSFIFRAVTPPGRPRRFDARFFMARADAIEGDADDFSGADGELHDLAWVPLHEAVARDIPLITAAALKEVKARLADTNTNARPVPYFHQGTQTGAVRMI